MKNKLKLINLTNCEKIKKTIEKYSIKKNSKLFLMEIKSEWVISNIVMDLSRSIKKRKMKKDILNINKIENTFDSFKNDLFKEIFKISLNNIAFPDMSKDTSLVYKEVVISLIVLIHDEIDSKIDNSIKRKFLNKRYRFSDRKFYDL